MTQTTNRLDLRAATYTSFDETTGELRREHNQEWLEEDDSNDLADLAYPVIAVPHQRPPEIWWGDATNGQVRDQHTVLRDRESAEWHVTAKRHQWSKVSQLIDRAWRAEEVR